MMTGMLLWVTLKAPGMLNVYLLCRNRVHCASLQILVDLKTSMHLSNIGLMAHKSQSR